MEQIEFNLLEEPWIRVMKKDCTIEECSLTQALLNSHEYLRLSGELPTQDVAILRLLLAVLHTVFYRVDTDGQRDPIEDEKQAIERWCDLWQAKRLPQKPICEYLEQWKDRFWLFHPEHPFYQVPAAERGTGYFAAKLNGELAESANKVRLFPVRTKENKTNLSYSEAARWLLTLMGFDDSSTKVETGTKNGWLGQHINLYAVGSNLYETLLLNLIFLRDGQEVWEENMPIWEKTTPKEAKKREIAVPDNQAELLTLQSRRVLLYRKNGKVTAYRTTGGDFFGENGSINAFSEQMTQWQKGKEKKNAAPQFFPMRANMERQMWRDFEVLADHRTGQHIPGVVSWIQALKSERIIEKKMVRFASVGAVYDAKGSTVIDVMSDHLDFHTELLEDAGKLWIGAIQDQIEKTERAAWLLGKLAERIFKAEGGQPDGNAQAARSHQAAQDYYAAVDLPFREWLCSVDPQMGDDEDQRRDKQRQWSLEACRIALKQGQEMVRNAGSAAYVGRWIVNKKTEKAELYSSCSAFNQLKREIYKCFDIPIVKKEAVDE